MKFNKGYMAFVLTAMLMMTTMLSMIDVGESMPSRAAPALSGWYGYGTMYEDSFFNFSARYTDTDGDVPQFVYVNIDGTIYNMTNTFGSTDYIRGVPYHYNTTLVAGAHPYFFYSMNSNGEWVYDPPTGNYSVNVLSRNGSLPTLTNPSFTVVRLVKGTSVNFTVIYTDLDNDPATAVKIMIDQSNGTMLDGSFGDGSYPQIGVSYYYNITLNEGNHSYYYWARNSANETVRLPESGYYTLKIPDSKHPRLTGWSVSPDPVCYGNPINFTVYYKHELGYQPDVVQVKLRDGDFRNDTWNIYPMTIYGNDYTSGVRCESHFDFTLPSGIGLYQLYFEALLNDTYFQIGPYYLNVTNGSAGDNDPILYNGSVDSKDPVENQIISFSVWYKDLDNDAPTYVKIHIDPINQSVSSIRSGELMTNGNSYDTGVIFSAGVILPAGNYTYHFSTLSFGTLAYTENYTLVVRPRTTNRAPQLLSPSVSPARPFSGQLVTFSVTYKDADNDPPEQFLLKVTPSSGGAPFTVKMLTPYSYAYSTGLVFSGSLQLTRGNYTYFFTVTSKNVTVNLPATGSYSLYVSAPPSLGSAPTLYSARVSPSSPINNQVVNFTIYYKDLDDDAPSYVKLYLSSVNSSRSFTNYSMRVSGSVYSQGVLCIYAKSLASGTYYYYFQASSGNDTVTYPSTGYGMLIVGTSGGSSGNNSVRCAISVVDGEADLTIEDEGTTITLSIIDLDDDKLTMQVESDTGESKVIILDIDPSVLDLSDPDRLRILIDGERVSLVDLDWMNDPSGSEPRYHIVIDDEGAHLYLYMPDTSSHIVEASIVKGDIENSNGWILALMAVVVILVIVAVAMALLSRAQVEKRKKVEEYYEDFDISTADDRVTGGSLEEEESYVDWDELL